MMTAKQKLNRERFKAAIAEAKKIREKNPKLTQAEAVKKAWPIIYSKKSKLGAVGKTKETAIYKGYKIIKGSYISDYDNLKYSYTVLDKENYQPFKRQNYFKTVAAAKKEIDSVLGNNGLTFSGMKKTAKKSAKKPAAKSMHKDTKSHNVNIRVMSGYNGVQHLKNLVEEKSKLEQKLIAVQNYKNDKNPEVKKHYKYWNARLKKIIASLKKQITEAKKSIQ